MELRDHRERITGPPPVSESSPRTSDSNRRLTRILLAAGVAMAGLNLIALGILWTTDTALFTRVMAVLGAAYVGGRIAGILAGLELGLGNLVTSLVIILFNTGFLLLALPLFQMATGRLKLAALFRGAERRARSQNRRLESFGIIGLVFFIWLPFTFTGAFLGALIGLLMGIPLIRLVPIVLVTMWLGVFTWTWGIDFIFLFTGTTGHIVAWVLTAFFLALSVVLRIRDSRSPNSDGKEVQS